MYYMITRHRATSTLNSMAMEEDPAHGTNGHVSVTNVSLQNEGHLCGILKDNLSKI